MIVVAAGLSARRGCPKQQYLVLLVAVAGGRYYEDAVLSRPADCWFVVAT